MPAPADKDRQQGEELLVDVNSQGLRLREKIPPRLAEAGFGLIPLNFPGRRLDRGRFRADEYRSAREPRPALPIVFRAGLILTKLRNSGRFLAANPGRPRPG